MNLGRCPVCHSRLHLDAIVQDESGRELLAWMAKLDRSVAVPLVAYLSLFRSKSRDLANDRALRLVEETMQLAPADHLVPALVQTVETMRAKQQAGGFKPLANHNYLKQVLKSAGVAYVESGVIEEIPAEMKPADKRKAVTCAIMNFKDTDW